jgi:glycosyltransferase involved in cell wall biosynthesis
MVFCKIIVPIDQFGLRRDAIAFKNEIPDSIIVEIWKSKDVPLSNVNIILENLDESQISILKTAKINGLMVNNEFLNFKTQLHVYKRMNFFICKSKFGYKYTKIELKKYNINAKVFYTKFTTPDVEKVTDTEIKDKKFNLVFHGAGSSEFKNTDIFLKCLENKDLTNYEFYIFCWRKCLKYINKENIKNNKYTKTKNNVHFYTESQSEDKLLELKKICGVHICPSYIEGYGHYINEARKNKSIVVTTDFPPMNELVNSKSGFLLPVVKFQNRSINSIPGCYVSENDIYNILNKISNLSTKEKIKMCERSYQNFVKDTKYFKNKMKKIFKWLNVYES